MPNKRFELSCAFKAWEYKPSLRLSILSEVSLGGHNYNRNLVFTHVLMLFFVPFPADSSTGVTSQSWAKLKVFSYKKVWNRQGSCPRYKHLSSLSPPSCVCSTFSSHNTGGKQCGYLSDRQNWSMLIFIAMLSMSLWCRMIGSVECFISAMIIKNLIRYLGYWARTHWSGDAVRPESMFAALVNW